MLMLEASMDFRWVYEFHAYSRAQWPYGYMSTSLEHGSGISIPVVIDTKQ